MSLLDKQPPLLEGILLAIIQKAVTQTAVCIIQNILLWSHPRQKAAMRGGQGQRALYIP